MKHSVFEDNDFKELLAFLKRPWKGYRRVRKGPMKRIRRHMRSLGISDASSYISCLSNCAVERKKCEQLLQITISRFFRDRELWQHLHDHILPELLTECEGKTSIWSAGCGCGEEPYSLSILLHRLASDAGAKILATDISQKNLLRARQAQYSYSSLKEVPPAILDTYFIKVANGDEYEIADNCRKNIVWQQRNLLTDIPAERFDMVLLRNSLLTYHQGQIVQDVLSGIVTRLKQGGYLVTGSHESLPTGFDHLQQSTYFSFLYKRC